MNPPLIRQTHAFEGGAVCDPDKGFHGSVPLSVAVQKYPELQELLDSGKFTPEMIMIIIIQTHDYASLYPSIIRTLDLCPSNFLGTETEAYKNVVRKLDAKEELDWKEYLACFAINENCVLPKLLAELADLRKSYKKKMKKAAADLKKAKEENNREEIKRASLEEKSMNAAQLSVKVSCLFFAKHVMTRFPVGFLQFRRAVLTRGCRW